MFPLLQYTQNSKRERLELNFKSQDTLYYSVLREDWKFVRLRIVYEPLQFGIP